MPTDKELASALLPFDEDDFPYDGITPADAHDKKELMTMTSTPNFDEDNPEHKAIIEGYFTKLSQNNLEKIKAHTAVAGEIQQTRCLPNEFADKDISIRYHKATMVNLYFEYAGHWRRIKDSRSVSRKTLMGYWVDDIFRAKILAMDPIITMEAKGVVIEIMADSQDDKVRLAAATRWLESQDPNTWDRGVRKQIVANKGSLENTLLSKVIDDAEYLNGLVNDRLNRLPEDVRDKLQQAVELMKGSKEQTKRMEENHTIDVAVEPIRAVDITKLSDPFDIPKPVKKE